jgi:hypothetical protein
MYPRSESVVQLQFFPACQTTANLYPPFLDTHINVRAGNTRVFPNQATEEEKKPPVGLHGRIV